MRGILFLAAALWLLGCEQAGSAGGVAQQAELSAGAARFTPEDLRLSLAHSGVRRFVFPQTSGVGGQYRERITTDGHGRFSVVPLESGHSSPAEWDEFELRQRTRQGFLFRYRDFQVRDAGQFERNWSVVDLGRIETVAGHDCDVFRLERRGGARVAFELALERRTGLVLASREFVDGQLGATMTYESLDLAPDLEAVAWHQASNAEQACPDVAALEAELQVRTLQPRLLPQGYAPLEVATVQDGDHTTWLKHTYSDGVEPLFFLQALDEAARVEVSEAGITVEKLAPASSVIVFELGTATAIQGKVEGRRVLAIGKVGEAELLDLIESSLP